MTGDSENEPLGMMRSSVVGQPRLLHAGDNDLPRMGIHAANRALGCGARSALCALTSWRPPPLVWGHPHQPIVCRRCRSRSSSVALRARNRSFSTCRALQRVWKARRVEGKGGGVWGRAFVAAEGLRGRG